MKFHLIASVEGDKETYKIIFKLLEELDCKPVTYHILRRTIEEINKETSQESEQYFRKMINWQQKADFVVFEVTTNEFACGCEMMIALEKCRPVIVLYQEGLGRVPPMLKGFINERIQMYSYNKNDIPELKQILKIAVNDIKELTDIRFTLLLPPNIVSYLEDISRKKKMPKSVFIRNLIEREIEKK